MNDLIHQSLAQDFQGENSRRRDSYGGWLTVQLLALSLVLGGLPTAWAHPVSRARPGIYDTIPLPAKSCARRLVTFYFDQPMDRASVGCLGVAPRSPGAVLARRHDIGSPSASYERATEYAFTIGTARLYGWRGDGGSLTLG
jgi:hypothetical protein